MSSVKNTSSGYYTRGVGRKGAVLVNDYQHHELLRFSAISAEGTAPHTSLAMPSAQCGPANLWLLSHSFPRQPIPLWQSWILGSHHMWTSSFQGEPRYLDLLEKSGRRDQLLQTPRRSLERSRMQADEHWNPWQWIPSRKTEIGLLAWTLYPEPCCVATGSVRSSV